MYGGNRYSRGLDRGSRGRGQMNRTESKYAAELETRKRLGEISDCWYEAVGLRLTQPPEGKAVIYWPDFLVVYPDGETHLVDVKGSGPDNDASIVRLKCAAERYPIWRFLLVKQRKARDGGGWHVTEV